jgi:hypothetical protein
MIGTNFISALEALHCSEILIEHWEGYIRAKF